MENVSLPGDVWNNITTSSSKDDNDLTLYLANIRDLALKVTYIIIGTVGIIDNLFVILVFALFVTITDRVLAMAIFTRFIAVYLLLSVCQPSHTLQYYAKTVKSIGEIFFITQQPLNPSFLSTY